MMKQASRLRKVLAIVVVAFLLLVSYFLTWTYFHSLSEAENIVLMRLSGIANSMALQIDGDAHEQLMRQYTQTDAIKAKDQDSIYLKIHQVLQRNATATMLKTPAYTLFLDASNQCFFGVTSSNTPYFRHPYHSAPLQLLEKHLEGATIPTYTDEFGTWLSAFAAVKNKKGEMVAWIQVDQNFDEFMLQTRISVFKNLFISLLVFLGLFIGLIRVLQPLLKKERQDKEALTAALAKNEFLSEQLQDSLQKITKLDQFRREMVANLSHDLRTPLSIILGYLDTLHLKKNQLSETEKQSYLNIVTSEANRLQGLVTGLFDLSKLESDHLQLELEPFNILELAQDTLQKYQLMAQTNHVNLLVNFGENLPFAYADIRWIDRVLQNLLDNAIRFAGEGGFVQFSVFLVDDLLHFKVCNSGEPISAPKLDTVFDRYFTTTNRKNNHSGLGLAIVKKIIDLHHQRVWAEATPEITTLRFTLAVFKNK